MGKGLAIEKVVCWIATINIAMYKISLTDTKCSSRLGWFRGNSVLSRYTANLDPTKEHSYENTVAFLCWMRFLIY